MDTSQISPYSKYTTPRMVIGADHTLTLYLPHWLRENFSKRYVVIPNVEWLFGSNSTSRNGQFILSELLFGWFPLQMSSGEYLGNPLCWGGTTVFPFRMECNIRTHSILFRHGSLNECCSLGNYKGSLNRLKCIVIDMIRLTTVRLQVEQIQLVANIA